MFIDIEDLKRYLILLEKHATACRDRDVHPDDLADIEELMASVRDEIRLATN